MCLLEQVVALVAELGRAHVKVTLQPGNINGGPVSAFPTTGFQSDLTATVAEMPGIVTINNDICSLPVEPSPSQRSPLTCLADNTAGGQISLNTQALGASFTEQDSGQDSIRSNTLGVAEASDTAEQSGAKANDISALSEIFGASEDFDSALEEGSEAWFDFLTQSSGVVDEIIPTQGPTERYGVKCYYIYDECKIDSCLAGKVKVYLEFEGSNERSIGSTDFEFIKNNDQVIHEMLSKLEMGQDELFKTFGTLAGAFSSRSRGVQQATPRGAGGTGSSNVNKRDDAILEKILTLLVYKAAEIDGREFLEMVFSTSAGRLVFNHYRNSSTSPGDVARANGHTNLGDFLEDVNERLSKEVCYEDSYETVDWLGLKHAVEKKVCPPSTDDAQSVDSPGGDMNQSGYEADDEVSPLPSPADTDAIGSEMDDSQHESFIHADSGHITLGYVSGEIDCKYKILFWIIIILNLFISDASFLVRLLQQEHVPKQEEKVSGMGHCQETWDDLNYMAEAAYILVINSFIFSKRSNVERPAKDVNNLRSFSDDFDFL
ncbi:hypothetical protein AWC38_SpisGene20316 [Stylophora pistillata]|uniref:Uncharacterized protein n=1 Tax=Stylophora pistillata TaxID=50429 RepID=A0A2B4RF72_STYPI|nr:hypothetical protein AWC38_SpisGene20316 [Stylophora pistillata]